MKVLVLGATGGTGREICRAAAAKGHSVVALVRSVARAQNLTGASLVEGDARDEAALQRAAGCSGVISSLGTSVSPLSEVTLLSTATRALVKVMAREGIRRLVCITGLGAGDSRGHGGFVFDKLIMPLLLRKVYEDKDRQKDIVRASGLDWVLVRPMVLPSSARPVRAAPVFKFWRTLAVSVAGSSSSVCVPVAPAPLRGRAVSREKSGGLHAPD